jgi:hypothetical protein
VEALRPGSSGRNGVLIVELALHNRGTNVGLVLVVGDDLNRFFSEAFPLESSKAAPAVSTEPSSESDERTPVSSVSMPNLTTAPEISAVAG